jgi:1-acyl-sn-glycerol-3-phosphate acyltransferase
MGIIRVVRGGGAALIFPEGSRSPNGQLQDAQPGIGLIVAKTGAPVVPVRISGSYEAFPRGSKRIRRFSTEVRIGERLDFLDIPQQGRDRYQHISSIIMKAISKLS